MGAEELKHELINIFGANILFNKDFNKYADSIKNINDNLIKWCNLVKEEKIRALRSPKLIGDLVFIKKIGSSNRCIVIKITDGAFKEIHLGDHDYYDRLRKKLGLKKNNKYY